MPERETRAEPNSLMRLIEFLGSALVRKLAIEKERELKISEHVDLTTGGQEIQEESIFKRPQTPEIVDAHQPNRLPLEHWLAISKVNFGPRMSEWRYFSGDDAAKIGRFANEVSSGILDNNRQTSRQFLGQRHWKLVVTGLDNRLNGVFGNLEKRFRTKKYNLLKHVRPFAVYESNTYLTLNDFIIFIGASARIVIPGESSQWLKWNREDSSWHRYNENIKEEYKGLDLRSIGWWDEGEAIEKIFETKDLGVDNSDQANQLIAKQFELTSQELPNASSESPEEILSIAKNTISSDVYYERVFLTKNRIRFDHGKPTLYGWEKEI